MTDYTKLFYWVSVADSATTFFGSFAAIFTIISIIATVIYFFGLTSDNFSDNVKEGQKVSERSSFIDNTRKWLFWCYPFMILFWGGIIFTPNKKQSLLIIAGGQTLNYLTTDTIAKQVPHEVMNYVVTELKNMASEAKIDLGIKTEKEKVLESVKNLTSDQLIEKMKSDENLTKIILDKK